LGPELQQVLEQVAEIRQLPAPANLRVTLLKRSDVGDELDRQISDDDRRTFDHLTRLYRLLGHLGPNQTYEEAYREFIGSNVAAFYSPRDKRLYVVTDDDWLQFDTLTTAERTTIAHEFVHAIQDNSFDLQARFESTVGDLDWSLALTSVVEGDAVNTASRWAARYARDWRQGQAELASLSVLGGVPPTLDAEFRFPYSAGLEWVNRVRGGGGDAVIDGVLKGERVTTNAILGGLDFPSAPDPGSKPLPDVEKSLGGGWRHETGGAFGEFQFSNYLRLHLPALTAVTSTAGWAGDRYDVYRNGSRSVAVFRVRFAAAMPFWAAQDEWWRAADATVSARPDQSTLAELPGGITAVRAAPEGNEVLFVIGSDRATAERAFDLVAGG
jgi:hypothetical protein